MKMLKFQVIQTVKIVEIDTDQPGVAKEIHGITVFMPEVFDVSILNLDGIAKDTVSTLRKMLDQDSAV